MKNKEMHSYTIDEVKEQLVRFFFSSYCFGFAGSIELLNNGISIKYRHNNSYDENVENYIEYEFTIDNWNKFVENIFNLNIFKWKEKYENKVFATDCEEWTVEIELKNLEAFKSNGYDEYPYNWKKFQDIIREFFPQMEY